MPAAVTIAQAIDESAWGNSQLAAKYHNLFGIKGVGPAGSVDLPTSEFYNGQWVNIDAPFRVYHNVAESIADHAELLATSGYYQRAMADRAVPDAFANDLTGVYATDPDYGATIIAIMKLYNLYRFDSPATASQPTATAAPTASARANRDRRANRHSPGQTPAPAAASGREAPVSHATADQGTAPSEAQIPGLATPALAPTPTPTPTTAGAGAGARSGATSSAAGAVIPGVAAQNSAQHVAAQHAPPASPARGGASIPGLPPPPPPPATPMANFQRQPAATATGRPRPRPRSRPRPAISRSSRKR